MRECFVKVVFKLNRSCSERHEDEKNISAEGTEDAKA